MIRSAAENKNSMLPRVAVARRLVVRARAQRPRRWSRAASTRRIPDHPVPQPPPPPGYKEATTGPIIGPATTTGAGSAAARQEAAFAFSPAKNAAVALGLCGFVTAVYYQTISAITDGSKEELGDDWDKKNEIKPADAK